MQQPTLPPFDHIPAPYTGPSVEEVSRLRKEFLNPGLFHYYQKPIMLVEGRAQYLYDEKGRRYLDAIGGIVTVGCGHCHPKIVAAANRQSELLQHAPTIYLHPNIVEYARGPRRQDARRPEGRSTSSTAARKPTTSRCSWPARTRATTTCSRCATPTTAATAPAWDSPRIRRGNSTCRIPSACITRVAPDQYRGHVRLRRSRRRAQVRRRREKRHRLHDQRPGGGVHRGVDPGRRRHHRFPRRLSGKSAYAHVRAAGGVCIADEVQAGFGRTGSALSGDSRRRAWCPTS